MNTSLPQRAAVRLLEAGARLDQTPVLLGFDGFIDTIYHAVDTRQSATQYTRIPTLKAFGERIVAAAGKSTNVEIVPQDVKLGGNGPIMAFAMTSLGAPVTYCGMTGYPTVHEVFRALDQKALLLPITDPALTDAYEFEDGKLIVGKHATVAEVSYENIVERVGEASWQAAWQSARFVAMVNWTMLPYLTDLWKRLQSEAGSTSGRKTLFFDLADPEKRTSADLLGALDTIVRFQAEHDVILGLNEKEAQQVASVLNVASSQRDAPSYEEAEHGAMIDLAHGIREKLEVGTCVVHPTRFAAAANANDAVAVAGPFTAHPKISTGAGDHFNAGFCCGQIMGCDLEESLQIGVATSGFYVRHASSPTQGELAEFLNTL